jgi:hypothetical protein
LPSRRKGKLVVAFETLFYYFVNWRSDNYNALK